MKPRWSRRALGLALVMLSGGCAKQGMPPGGPEDRTAPRIVASEPESGSTGIALGAPVTVTFSEAMQRPSVEGAISLFPPPPGGLELRWRGTSLEITPDTIWAPDQTYVLTLQAEARDLRGNRLGQTLQLAFSTGARIDSGTVRGRILRDGRPLRGATALCYRTADAMLNPETDTADYVVLADSLGQFEFGFLAPGRYRVFGLDDRDRDWLWNVGSEAIAVPALDLEVGTGRFMEELPPLALVPLDTTLPRILDCRMVAPGLAAVDCSEALDSTRLGRQRVQLSGVGGAESLPLFAPDSLARQLFVALPDLPVDARPVLSVDFEHPGNGERYADSCTLDLPARWEQPAGNLPLQAEPDSTTTKLAFRSTLRLRLAAPAAGLAVDSVAWRAEARSGQAACSLSSPYTVAVALPADADGYGPVVLELPLLAVRWKAGGAWPEDSVRRIRIPFPYRDSTGEFELRPLVTDAQYGPFLRVGLQSAPAGSAPLWVAPAPGGVLRGALRYGDYRVTLFADRNGDGHRDVGWPYPYRPSEPVWPIADTLHVRARFTTELSIAVDSKKQLP